MKRWVKTGLIPLFLMTFVISYLSGPLLYAEFFKYKDDKGNWVYVDDIDKVPPQYSDQINAYKSTYDTLSEDQKTRQRQLDIEKEKAARRAFDAEVEASRREMREDEIRAYENKQREIIKKSKTPVIIEHNRVLVPVTLTVKGIRRKANFLLDTGAGHIVLHEDFADQLRIDKRARGKSIVAGGGRILSFLGYADQVSVGPVTMKNAPVVIIRHNGPSMNFVGLLGMNFLKHVKYRIDFENSAILWYP